MKTVLITGSSSGIGLATAELFAARGWNVVATLRTPDACSALAGTGCFVTALDVLDEGSITAAFGATTERFGGVDVVVNNAGYALVGAFESLEADQVDRQLATNVTGVMNVCRVAIPHMRARGSGTIVNVSSMGGRITFPFYSAYHATKWAVEGFSEALQHELSAVGIRVRIVEPGPIATDFYGRSMDTAAMPDEGNPYEPLAGRAMRNMQASGANGAPPRVVARVIYRAATSRWGRLRYPAGGTARLLLALRGILPEAAFTRVIRAAVSR